MSSRHVRIGVLAFATGPAVDVGFVRHAVAASAVGRVTRLCRCFTLWLIVPVGISLAGYGARGQIKRAGLCRYK